MTIRFDAAPRHTLILDSLADVPVQAARVLVESLVGAPLPVDPKTGFPSFTVYHDDGEEMGGG